MLLSFSQLQDVEVRASGHLLRVAVKVLVVATEEVQCGWPDVAQQQMEEVKRSCCFDSPATVKVTDTIKHYQSWNDEQNLSKNPSARRQNFRERKKWSKSLESKVTTLLFHLEPFPKIAYYSFGLEIQISAVFDWVPLVVLLFPRIVLLW